MDQEQLHAEVADLVQAVGLLVRRMRAMNAADELSLTQTAVMGRLAREGPATISDLARAEGVKPQSMGASIAVLEERGIVEREPHPTDGRQFTIRLTEHGAAVRDKNRTAKRAWLEQAISQLNEEEQKTLFAATEIIQRLGEL